MGHSSVDLLLLGEQEEGLRWMGTQQSGLQWVMVSFGNAIGRLSRAVPVITLMEGAREESLLGDTTVVFERPG